MVEDEGGYRRVFIKDQRIIGVISLGGLFRMGAYHSAMNQQTSLAGIHLANLSISALLQKLGKVQGSSVK